MKDFVKKYWTHFLNIAYFLFFVFMMNITRIAVINDNIKPEGFIILLMIGGTLSIAVVAEMICYIVIALRSKELPNRVIHAVLIYFLNVFYIPCFVLSQIYKDSKAKIKNTIYVIISVVLCASLFTSVLAFTYTSAKAAFDEILFETTSLEKYTSKDKAITISVPKGYKQSSDAGDFDMYFSKNDYLHLGIFIYDDAQETAQEIIDYQESYLKKTRKEFTYINKESYKKNGKTIEIRHYKAKYNNDINYYNLAIVEFDKNNDYKICFIESYVYEYDNTGKKELKEILDNIELNK